jgi:hypothetical protein
VLHTDTNLGAVLTLYPLDVDKSLVLLFVVAAC